MPRYIADLEIHSRFARAVSKDMNLDTLEYWGTKKGIDLIGTGDFTHPTWFKELRDGLEEDGSGFLKRRGSTASVRFMLSAEVSCIFGRDGTRRVHVLLYAPSLADAANINAQLNVRGKLASDGRPIIGIDTIELTKLVLNAAPNALIVPAHVWTPWFGMYGSNSGFNSMADCFGELAEQIVAVETGLSSDPPMNWRLSELDRKTIISFSDAHSPKNIGREATIFELTKPTYENLAQALHIPFPTTQDPNRIATTVEFFPEEGMYHWDGHRAHDVRLAPAETKRRKGICPKCGAKVTVGVLHRVDDLADRPDSYRDPKRPPYKSLVPLMETIGEALDVGKLTKTVEKVYDQLVNSIGPEFKILLDADLKDIAAVTDPRVVEAIKRVREGKLEITPGYDGVYGTVKIFSAADRQKIGQSKLF